MENDFLLLLAGVVLAWVLWDRWRMKNSPYYRTLAEVRKRLEFAQFSGQSLETQEWRAKLAWMEALAEARRGHLKKVAPSELEKRLSALSPEDFAFPKTLDCGHRDHLEYAEHLLQAVAGLYASGDTRTSRSEEELPYPKQEILRAADAFLDHLRRTSQNEPDLYPGEARKSIETLIASLRGFYLPLPKAALACTGSENTRAGMDYFRERDSAGQRS